MRTNHFYVNPVSPPGPDYSQAVRKRSRYDRVAPAPEKYWLNPPPPQAKAALQAPPEAEAPSPAEPQESAATKIMRKANEVDMEVLALQLQDPSYASLTSLIGAEFAALRDRGRVVSERAAEAAAEEI